MGLSLNEDIASASKTKDMWEFIDFRTNSFVELLWPKPGPIITEFIFLFLAKSRNSSLLDISLSITEVKCDALTIKASLSEAKVTAPEPTRKAETDANLEATVDEIFPDLTKVLPLRYLWSFKVGHL